MRPLGLPEPPTRDLGLSLARRHWTSAGWARV